ncbi:MAG: diaminopimelate epimerase [Bacillota bacterium]
MSSTTRVEVPFTKMEGLGNDYLYIDRFHYKTDHDWGALSRAMAERHFGAGSDGIILIEPGDKAPLRMRIFNADGSEGDMCGNGMRCFTRYVYDHGIAKDTHMVVETRHGLIYPVVNVKDGVIESISVDMGVPLFARKDVPFAPEGPEPVVNEPVTVDGQVYLVTALSTGNPHGVIFVDDVWKVDLEDVGPKLERHPAFPRKANIEFAKIRSKTLIDMRVWERGSGITLACGTGACAVMVAAALNGYTEKDIPVTVRLPGGPLTIEWKSDNHVWMTGPAREVYRGFFFYEP